MTEPTTDAAGTGAARGPGRLGPARWLTLALTLAGAAVAAYLTWVHYTEPTSLACPDTGVINCTKVTTSDQSYLFGVPVAVLGVLFFAGMGALCSPRAWRAPSPWAARARLVGAAGGLVMVLWLVYAEVVLIGAICLWCTVVHVLTLALALTLLWVTLSPNDAIEPAGEDSPVTER